MKKLIIALLVLLAIGLAAVVTCPDHQAHKDAIMTIVNECINDEMNPSGTDNTGLANLFGSIGSSVAGYMIDNRLTVKNHFMYSIGEFKDLEGQDKTVSIGVFGHVFTFKKEDVQKYLIGE